MNVMLQSGPDLPYGTVPGAPRSDGKTFFGVYLYLAGRPCKIPKVPGATLNVNLARE